MALEQYTPLANITLSSAAATVNFSSIPQIYKDIIIIYDGQTIDSGNYDIRLKMNGDFNTYSFTTICYGGGASGSTASSFTQASSNIANFGPSNKTNMVAQILDYAASDKYKTALIRINASSSGAAMAAMRYASTSALISVAIEIGAGTFIAGSTFSLYGVR